MLCWGSWANTQKLAAGNWRFELFYWDYVFGIVILSLIFAFTMGTFGEGGRSFLEDLRQAERSNLLSATLGGVIFNAANILLVAAIAIAGMSVAFPVGIGIALVLGVVVNYIDSPQGNAVMLFGGVLLIVIAIILNARAYQKMASTNTNPSTKGLVLSVMAGLLMGFFYRFVATAMFSDFNVPEAGKISPYTAMVFFAMGILVSNLLFNTYIMKKPFTGRPVSFDNYFRGSALNHVSGILGGMIWCTGMVFSIVAAGRAGAAISYGLGQGATVVAAMWGIFIWREFKGAPKGTSTVLNIMLLLYVAGIVSIILAK
jgi:glucose uptake protein